MESPLPLPSTFLELRVSEWGGIAERRIEEVDQSRLIRLACFSYDRRGASFRIGLMVQVSAAALASESKILAHPATVDSIPTS